MTVISDVDVDFNSVASRCHSGMNVSVFLTSFVSGTTALRCDSHQQMSRKKPDRGILASMMF